MERYIIFIPADGPCRLVACDDGDSIKLETLQELVDGPIEVTPSCLGASWAREPVDGINLIVNEEGRLRCRTMAGHQICGRAAVFASSTVTRCWQPPRVRI